MQMRMDVVVGGTSSPADVQKCLSSLSQIEGDL